MTILYYQHLEAQSAHIIEGFLDISRGCFNILSLLHIMRDEDKMMVMIHNALTNSILQTLSRG